MQEVDRPGVGRGGQGAVIRVGGVSAERDDVSGAEQGTVGGCENGGRRWAADPDRDRCREGRVHAVRDREPRRVLTRLRVGVARICRGRGAAVPERPGVGQRLALRIGRAGTREADGKRRRPGAGSCRPDRDRRLVPAHKANPADLADAEGAAGVGVAEIDVVQRSLGSLREVHDVAVGAVGGAVRRFEVEDAVDVPARVEGQPLDPVLCVVGEEVAALVAARELCPVVDEPTRDRRVPAVVRVGIERALAGAGARAFAVRPAVVGASRAEVDLLPGGSGVVAADVADEEPAGGQSRSRRGRDCADRAPRSSRRSARSRRRTGCRLAPSHSG